MASKPWRTVDNSGGSDPVLHSTEAAAYEWVGGQPAGASFDVQQYDPEFSEWQTHEMRVRPEQIGAAS